MMDKKQKHAAELMPNSEEALPILRARAEQLAEAEVKEKENHRIVFIHFKLEINESYGIPYQFVQEILHNVRVELPPLVPNFIAGVINWQGSLITVIDLSQFFYPNRSKPRNGYIIIVKFNDMTLGLLVNQVEGSGVYQPNQLSPSLTSIKTTHPEYVLGLHQAVTAILNVELLVTGVNQEIKKNHSG